MTRRELPYALLWCDQDVYKIGKKNKFFKPDKFDSIFLGMGGFHTEKIVLVSIENFWKEI